MKCACVHRRVAATSVYVICRSLNYQVQEPHWGRLRSRRFVLLSLKISETVGQGSSKPNNTSLGLHSSSRLSYSATNVTFIALLTVNISTTEIIWRPSRWEKTTFCEEFKIWNRVVIAVFKNYSVYGRRHIVV
jgi:hypothetical protein